ncbi:MAG: NADH-quinone oxidoreductase subunit J [Candidatus Omnitrophica bacterium]|nr:NADH-quinone oxidoreductase subunit J [Candidatus Omnitrophota bacterium]
MSLQELVFLGVAGITLAGACLAVTLKNVFYNALSLILCLFGVACLFIFLGSEFLAVIEVILYIGAIAVAILFAIMLSRPMFQKNVKRNPAKILQAFAVSAALFVGLARVIRSTPWPAAETDGDYGLAAIGKNLLTVSLVPFEAVSLVLLVAIIGALVLSAKGEPR